MACRQRSEVRALFLMEKYGRRWRQRTTQAAIAVNFLDGCWLRRVLFSRGSRLARRVAADLVETLASEPARKRRVSPGPAAGANGQCSGILGDILTLL